jgi:hypothetical protein
LTARADVGDAANRAWVMAMRIAFVPGAVKLVIGKP